MSLPTSADVHVDAALTDMSIAYIQSATNFIADRVFTPKPVMHQTDKYFIFDKNDWLRNDAVRKRAPGQPAPRSGFRLSTDSYSADDWWTSVPVNELVRANADAAVPLDEAAMRLVTQRMLIKREAEFASAFIDANVWGTNVVGNTNFTYWDDASSDPEADISTGKETVLKNTGLEPNTMVVSFKVHNALKRHPLIKSRFQYTSSASITEAMLAQFFEVDAYLVARASYATNAEGDTAAYSFIVGDHAVLLHRNGAPDVMTPTAGTVFTWSGLTGMNDLGVRIDRYYDADTKDDIVRGEFAFDMKVTGSDLGYRFQGCLSA